MEAFVRNFAELFLVALFLLVFARVLITWVDPMGRRQASVFIIQTTEPILAPVRRALPQSGAIDFSPTIVLLILFMLMRLF
ncbi:MAG TPA: YggT family protein [Candidatus Limnocylindrales bacterium]|nr:YggT family protein [Candidatus Limnocylindrales bacterium]